jgi:hypothetical protein
MSKSPPIPQPLGVGRLNKTIVVNCQKKDFDVYIGRGPCPKTGTIGKWGNPFKIGPDGTRMEVIRKYKEWIVKQPELMAALPELRGFRLGCWCVPKACHGQVLVELLESTADKDAATSQPDIFGSNLDFSKENC